MDIKFIASAQAAAKLGELGRSEDVKFSPDGKRLLLAGYTNNKLLVVDIQIDDLPERAVRLGDCLELTSAAFHEPHGVAFLDCDTIVVANRRGNVAVYRLPHSTSQAGPVAVTPIREINGGFFVSLGSPGSVAVMQLNRNRYEVLVCNNYLHYVTRHVIDSRLGYRSLRNTILLRNGLDIPDGVAVSSDKRWIAVSSHKTHSVLVYENKPGLDQRSSASGVLRNVEYPHGVCFAADDRQLIVADAGAPFVHVYGAEGGDWTGERDPIASVPVMDEETFQRGRYNPEEGGPKGLDVNAAMSLVATTCEHQVLRFFDLGRMLGRAQAG